MNSNWCNFRNQQQHWVKIPRWIVLFFRQDISNVQRIVTASKSPVNIGLMRRESGGVKECQMEKVSVSSNLTVRADVTWGPESSGFICSHPLLPAHTIRCQAFMTVVERWMEIFKIQIFKDMSSVLFSAQTSIKQSDSKKYIVIIDWESCKYCFADLIVIFHFRTCNKQIKSRLLLCPGLHYE